MLPPLFAHIAICLTIVNADLTIYPNAYALRYIVQDPSSYNSGYGFSPTIHLSISFIVLLCPSLPLYVYYIE